jgi:hypothetical protein
MKTIIYLPLIALIFLCGCKSNSFMTQRYTNFGHAGHKNTIAKKHIVKPERSLDETTKEEPIEYTQIASASETGPVLFIRETLLKPIKTNFQNINDSITKQQAGQVENSKTEFKSKKAIEKNRSAAQRIVGTLLKIILWIIILAVVVGVILIIGALA